MEECMIINQVAFDVAKAAEMQSFKQRVLADATFGQLAYLWQKLYENCCCGAPNAAMRLRFALNRIIARLDLPPDGPPLLQGDRCGEDSENLRFMSDELVSAAVGKNLAFLNRDIGGPFQRYLQQGIVWTRYKRAQGYGPTSSEGPPGLRIGWTPKVLHAFFAYRCNRCGRQYGALNQCLGSPPRQGPPGGGPSGGGPEEGPPGGGRPDGGQPNGGRPGGGRPRPRLTWTGTT